MSYYNNSILLFCPITIASYYMVYCVIVLVKKMGFANSVCVCVCDCLYPKLRGDQCSRSLSIHIYVCINKINYR